MDGISPLEFGQQLPQGMAIDYHISMEGLLFIFIALGLLAIVSMVVVCKVESRVDIADLTLGPGKINKP